MGFELDGIHVKIFIFWLFMKLSKYSINFLQKSGVYNTLWIHDEPKMWCFVFVPQLNGWHFSAMTKSTEYVCIPGWYTVGWSWGGGPLLLSKWCDYLMKQTTTEYARDEKDECMNETAACWDGEENAGIGCFLSSFHSISKQLVIPTDIPRGCQRALPQEASFFSRSPKRRRWRRTSAALLKKRASSKTPHTIITTACLSTQNCLSGLYLWTISLCHVRHQNNHMCCLSTQFHVSISKCHHLWLVAMVTVLYIFFSLFSPPPPEVRSVCCALAPLKLPLSSRTSRVGPCLTLTRFPPTTTTTFDAWHCGKCGPAWSHFLIWPGLPSAMILKSKAA